MTVSRGPYQPRFTRADPRFGITPLKLDTLFYVVQCGFLTTPQVQWIGRLSYKQATDRLKELKDHGLITRDQVVSSLLTWPDTTDPKANRKLSPFINYATKKGIDAMLASGRFTEESIRKTVLSRENVHPSQLRHEILVRDVRCWLEDCSRVNGGYVQRWLDGKEAEVLSVRPDALALYRMDDESTRYFAIEADRGTERGGQWPETKPAQYALALEQDELAARMGNRKVLRLLVVALDDQRRDWIAGKLKGTPIEGISWIANRGHLTGGKGFSEKVWRWPEHARMHTVLESRAE